MSLLAVSGLTKRFGGLVANRDISFTVAPGELVGVIGPNGAGKSTLFDLITGFQRPDLGTVRLDGEDITQAPAESPKTQVIDLMAALKQSLGMGGAEERKGPKGAADEPAEERRSGKA